ncbi:hypothetical protein CAC42_8052 [Sphaceloma murrayae]|uniref:Uncharacterized protein n=1 Tax=Sphaceloma murrayae TaxID=2082308 RepID=A0A2K1QRB5_9PEZI|nr:hypothetical protein CAC42_8052 [Sphaceloma murrayae]
MAPISFLIPHAPLDMGMASPTAAMWAFAPGSQKLPLNPFLIKRATDAEFESPIPLFVLLIMQWLLAIAVCVIMGMVLYNEVSAWLERRREKKRALDILQRLRPGSNTYWRLYETAHGEEATVKAKALAGVTRYGATGRRGL